MSKSSKSNSISRYYRKMFFFFISPTLNKIYKDFWNNVRLIGPGNSYYIGASL